jgi:ribosomal protein S18 acetylase RimI-like enzyme
LPVPAGDVAERITGGDTIIGADSLDVAMSDDGVTLSRTVRSHQDRDIAPPRRFVSLQVIWIGLGVEQYPFGLPGRARRAAPLRLPGSLTAMDEGMLRMRLWDGFARLQLLLGGHAGKGRTLEWDGLVASVVPNAPDSPTLNAAVALAPDRAATYVDALERLYQEATVRRWGIWIDGHATDAGQQLAQRGLLMTTASPGMGAAIDELPHDGAPTNPTDLTTVGRVNDLAYGNYDGRLERTLTPLPNGVLHAYRADLEDGSPAAVALALHHDHDAGISFVATVPKARRQGLATNVMQQALKDAQDNGCTTSTLQATDLGERLYRALGYRRLTLMQLWERRP